MNTITPQVACLLLYMSRFPWPQYRYVDVSSVPHLLDALDEAHKITPPVIRDVAPGTKELVTLTKHGEELVRAALSAMDALQNESRQL